MKPKAAMLVLVALAALLPAASGAAREDRPLPVTDHAALRALSRKFHADLLAHRPPAYARMLAGDLPALKRLHDRPDVDLMRLDDRGHPVFYKTTNVSSALTIGTVDVWPGHAAALSLDGADTDPNELAIWDGGIVRSSHQEFGGRVFVLNPLGTISDHSTHVAGTMIGAGVSPPAQGMSYESWLESYDWDDDLSEMSDAADLGLRISNHSYGSLCGWDFGDGPVWGGDPDVSSTEDYQFGFYSANARSYDELAHDAPYYTIVAAAGNDRVDAPPLPNMAHVHAIDGLIYMDSHDDDGGSTGYDTILPAQTAKNIITVGAVEDLPGGWTRSSDVDMTSFSSWGPTDDGRIKPDLVANGTDLWSALGTGDSDYGYKSGTSMASPSVAGSLNLLREQYGALHGHDPLASTLKAIAIHTADEAGPADGPDYKFGWGLMNTRHAAELIAADDATIFPYIIEGTLSEGEEDVYNIHYSGSTPLKFTLVWTDWAGPEGLPELDPTDKKLINDLDMRLSDDFGSYGTWGYPWVLDPNNPSDAATKDDNAVDNVEQIYETPDEGEECYTLRIQHKDHLAGGEQAYSLILSTPFVPCVGSPQIWPNTAPHLAYGPSKSFRGAGWFDLDGDGAEDMVGSVNNGPSLGARNLGGGLFDPENLGAAGASGPHMAMVAADYDNDGDVDLYAVNDGAPNQLFRNDGQVGFVNVATGALANSAAGRCAAWADFDRDGDLDLYVSNSGTTNLLLRNDGGDQFADVTPTILRMPVATNGVAWSDYDLDGDPDLYVANAVGPSRLFRNDGAGQFTDVTAGPLGVPNASYGAAWGDVNNDGRPDLYVTRDQAPNRLLLNQGDGSFVSVDSPVLQSVGGGRHVSFGDVDNDGDLDILLVQQGSSSRILLNSPTGWSVSPSFPSTTSSGNSAALGDYNGDGALDVFLVKTAPGDSNAVYTNYSCIGTRWIEMRLVGGPSNRQAIGARVEVVTAGQTRMREISAGSGYMGQDAAIVHFGLGSAPGTSTLRVHWPSGAIQEFHGASANRLYTVTEGQTVAVETAPNPGTNGAIRLFPAWPNPFRASASLSFEIPKPDRVRMAVYDLGGRKIRTLVDAQFSPGRKTVTWDGRDDAGSQLPPGAYFVRLQAHGQVATRSVLLTR